MLSFEDFPYFIALVFVLLTITIWVEIWKSFRTDNITVLALSPLFKLITKDAGSILIIIILGVVLFIYIWFFYFLPAIILVVSVEYFWGDQGDWTSDFILRAIEISKVAVLLCLADSFAESHSLSIRLPRLRYIRRFLIFLLPGYYAVISVSWLLSVALIRVVDFPPGSLISAGPIFAVPKLMPHAGWNSLGLILLVLLVTLIPYCLWRFRLPLS